MTIWCVLAWIPRHRLWCCVDGDDKMLLRWRLYSASKYGIWLAFSFQNNTIVRMILLIEHSFYFELEITQVYFIIIKFMMSINCASTIQIIIISLSSVTYRMRRQLRRSLFTQASISQPTDTMQRATSYEIKYLSTIYYLYSLLLQDE